MTSTVDPSGASRTDEDLLLDSRTDPEAFNFLIDRYAKKLYNYILRNTHDRPLSEDLLQETLLLAFGGRHKFGGRGSVSAWLYTISRNLIVDRARRSARRVVVPLAEASTIGSLDSEPRRAQIVDLTPGPEESVMMRADVKWVHEAVRRLPEPQREVLILSRFQSLSYHQIAELLSCSVDAVKQRAHRALLTLRAWYGSEAGEVRHERGM